MGAATGSRSRARRALVPLTLAVLGAAFLLAGLQLRRGYREERPQPPGLDVLYRPLRSPADIVEPAGPRVPPVAYTRAVSLADLPVPEKKRKFFAMMLPSVLIARHQLAELRREVVRVDTMAAPTATERAWLAGLLARWRADDVPALLRRLEDHPNSIVMAQAALESGWGTSRFFREGLNAFGIWSFDPAEPRMPAAGTRGDVRVYLKRYRSTVGSVRDYFLTIGRGPYADFRRARLRSRDPYFLAGHLLRYSELGPEYARRVEATIRSNDLHRFDAYRLDPRYLETEGP